MAKVVGVDLSYTATACVELECTSTTVTAEAEFKTTPKKFPGRLARIMHLRKLVLQFCQGAELVVVEGYSMGSINGREAAGELGGAVRIALFEDMIPVIEVAPQMLKKYVCGKGGVEKSMMLREVHRRWNYLAKSDDLADAYGLAMFGTKVLSPEPGSLDLQAMIAKCPRLG